MTSNITMTNWLQSLKQGDRVYINRGATHSISVIPATVERTTKTTIIVDGKKYRKSDGIKQGDWCYFMPYLLEANPKRDAEYRSHCLKKELKELNIDKLTVDQVERILAIAKEEKQ